MNHLVGKKHSQKSIMTSYLKNTALAILVSIKEIRLVSAKLNLNLAEIFVRKIALRWRVEKEVISGKGQFVCGEKRCGEEEGLRTWEVNFAYKEQGEKKNALVKISEGDNLFSKCY